MLELKQTKKRRLECRCCGQVYWDCTPSKILEHSASSLHTRLQQSSKRARDRQRRAQGVKATAQRIHAAEFAARSALKLAKSHGSRTQQAAGDTFFFSRSRRECSSSSNKRPSPRQPVSFARSVRQRGAAQFKHQRGRITVLSESSGQSACRVVPASFDVAEQECDAHEGREAHFTPKDAAR